MIRIRDANPADFAELHRLNNANTPHVNELRLQELEQLCGWAADVAIAEVDSCVAGFVIALRQGLTYSSLNYRYFDERFEEFVYIDRVVVGAQYRRRGIASALYDRVESIGEQPVTCEVNLRPTNPGSMSFHRSRGYVDLGTQTVGDKEVVLMYRTPTGLPLGE